MQRKKSSNLEAEAIEQDTVMLDTSTLMFRSVISEIEDYAIFVLDTEGKVQTWNKGAEKIKGYSEKEVVGKHFSMFYTEEDRKADIPQSILKEALEEGRAEHEGWRVGKDDDMFWAYVIITKLTDDDGNHIGFTKVTRDLSERIAAEKVINEYEHDLTEQAKKTSNIMSLYETFINEVEGYAINLIDKDGIVLDWNKGAEQMRGYKAEEVIGKHFSIFYSEEDRKALLPESLLYKARQYGRVENEGWRVRKDGTQYWVNVVMTVLKDEFTGEIKGYAKIIRDRTKKREIENQKAQYTSDLEVEIEKVKTRDELLQKAYDRLTKSTHVRSRFIKTATEDMQVPVKNIFDATNSLAKLFDAETVTIAKEHVNKILTSTNTLKKGIQDLALLSVVLENNVKVDNSSFNFRKMVSDILSGHQKEFSDKYKIEYEYDGETELDLSPMLVKYVVENTILNAVKFSPEQSLIRILSKNDGKKLTIQVHDSGMGIPAEEQKYLFESFFRGSNARHTEGTGLSLFLSSNFVKLMGGDISFESNADKGSTFTITLPSKAKNKEISSAS